MIEGLERFAIFDGLASDELAAIAKVCKAVKAKRGERIFHAGERAGSLFLVRAGTIELRFNVVHSNAPVEILLESVEGGQVFGWSAATPPYKYTLSAYAAEDSDLLRVDQADLESLCEVNVHLGYTFMKNTARLVGERFHAAQQMLIKEIQHGLKRTDPLA